MASSLRVHSLLAVAEARDKETWGSINGLEKNLAFHLSGHILHSIYWQNMTGPKDGGGEPLAQDGVGDLADAITDSFGSFAGFKAQAFYLQYKNQKVDFIDAMWAVVNRQDVAKRYAAAKERGDSLLLNP